MGDKLPENPMPAWMKILIVALALPVAGFPLLLAGAPADSMARLLVWFYLAYVAASAVCAWICYGQRPEVTWILLVLMALSHFSIYYLALGQ